MNIAYPSSLTVRPASERGHADHGWLRSAHSFSFADYYDPSHMGFRTLRVINDDHVSAGGGFDMHPHRDMEIFSYVISGALEHKDSLGNARVLRPGDIQLMSAGRGVLHSEYNPSQTEAAHFLQIWILPAQRSLQPSYTEWQPKPEHATQAKVLVISPDGREDSAMIHQDALVYRIKLAPGQTVHHTLKEGRGLWLQIASGQTRLQSQLLETGDGASAEVPGSYELTATQACEALLFDLG
jgi:hypothetical protein